MTSNLQSSATGPGARTKDLPAGTGTSWNAAVAVEVSLACCCTLGWSFHRVGGRPGWWRC